MHTAPIHTAQPRLLSAIATLLIGDLVWPMQCTERASFKVHHRLVLIQKALRAMVFESMAPSGRQLATACIARATHPRLLAAAACPK